MTYGNGRHGAYINILLLWLIRWHVLCAGLHCLHTQAATVTLLQVVYLSGADLAKAQHTGMPAVAYIRKVCWKFSSIALRAAGPSE